MAAPRVMAIAAHPDDIEFGMAGTMLLLRRSGCELHYLNIADGCCGAVATDRTTTAAIRLREAQSAADRLGATFHPPLVSDLEIFYEKSLLARLASIVRQVAPEILLIPSPDDYMEDHMNACRLAVTAAFCRGMPNFPVDPPRAPIPGPLTLYHAQPHGNRDGLGRFVRPNVLVTIDEVLDEKRALLAEHTSQKEWLDHSQGMDAYLNTMRAYSREMGVLTVGCQYAEGWRRHNPLGLCGETDDPLRDQLGPKVIPLEVDRDPTFR